MASVYHLIAMRSMEVVMTNLEMLKRKVEVLEELLREAKLDLAMEIELLKEESPRLYFCSTCGVNVVDAEDGYDTCPDCVNKI